MPPSRSPWVANKQFMNIGYVMEDFSINRRNPQIRFGILKNSMVPRGIPGSLVREILESQNHDPKP